MVPAGKLSTEIEYRSEDGKPMAESDFQRRPLTYAVEALGIYFQDCPNVYVSGDLFIYYEKGNPEAVVAPDVFVIFGAARRDRPSYRLWEEGKAPDFVLEITSKSTLSKDQGAKKGIYAFLGVREYFQYDPTSDYLDPQLQGLRLVEGNYLPIPPTIPDGLLLHSEVLGLDLRLQSGELRFYDPATGEKLLTHQEAAAALRAAEDRIAELETRLQALEAERLSE